jgi:integrase
VPKSPNKAKHRPKSADVPRRADPTAVAAIRFLMLTGFREQEALSLRWYAIDSARGVVTLADTKTGKSRRPFGAAVRDLLAALPRGGDYVFPGRAPGAPRKELRRVWYAVREAAALEGVRLHDLRHTVASFAASGGASLGMVAVLLGHKNTRTTERYAHLFDAVMSETADRAAGDIHAAMQGEVTPLTPLRRGTA